MKKIQSVILAVISATILVASIGFFATFGLAIVGLFSALAIIAIVYARVTQFAEQRNDTAGQCTRTREC